MSIPNAATHAELGFNPDTIARPTLRKRVSVARGRVKDGSASPQERALVRLWDDPNSGLKQPPGRRRQFAPGNGTAQPARVEAPAPAGAAFVEGTPPPSYTNESGAAPPIPHAPPPPIEAAAEPGQEETDTGGGSTPADDPKTVPPSSGAASTGKRTVAGGAMIAAAYMKAIREMNGLLQARFPMIALPEFVLTEVEACAVEVFADAGFLSPMTVVVGTPVYQATAIGGLLWFDYAKAKKQAQETGAPAHETPSEPARTPDPVTDANHVPSAEGVPVRAGVRTAADLLG